MRILFIRPKPSPETIGLQHLMIVEPLELEILATLVKEEHDVKIADMILEEKKAGDIIREYSPDVLCLTGYITHVPVIIQHCISAKKFNKDIITVAGGVHTEKYPGDISHEAIDYRVVRNATRTFPKLIDYLCKKTEFPEGVLRKDESADENKLPEYDFYVPIPDRTLTQKYRSKYFYIFHNKVALIKTSFGCPYKCNFCFCRIITGNNYFARPLNEVIEELKSIREKEVYIVDDDFLISAGRVREFIGLLKANNIRKKFLIYGRADFIAGNPGLIKEFKAAGLRTIIVGLESFEDIELKHFNKQTTYNINRHAMEILNRYGVDCYAAVIISPSWDYDDFKKAGKVMNELGIKFVNLQPLTPLKGTGIEILENELVIHRRDYPKWDLAHVSIRPEKMSLSEFYRNIYNLYIKIIGRPKNILSNFKYPLHMQIKLIKGMYRVKRQYESKIMEAAGNA